MVNVRPLSQNDKTRWHELWSAYLAFYEKHDLPHTVTANTWAMVCGAREDVYGLVAESSEGDIVGFVNCVVHPNTWTDKSICYLEDLYVDAAARGKGAGRALIEAVVDRAKTNGWGRVYWRTEHDNQTAQALYDRITPQGPWVMYQIDL